MNFSALLSDETLLLELGQRLAQLRLNRNLQQHELAKEAGLSLRTLSRIEAGEPSQTVNLLRLLRVLGLIENLDALMPPPPLSPMRQLELQGKERKRASRRTKASKAEGVAEPKPVWKWQSE